MYLKLAIPGFFMIVLEWSAWELGKVLTGAFKYFRQVIKIILIHDEKKRSYSVHRWAH